MSSPTSPRITTSGPRPIELREPANIIYITCPDHEIAKKLARGLVQEKLVACVNIVPGVTSIYSWENEIKEDSEVLLICKSLTNLVAGVTDYVKNNHPYEVPEVISVKVENGSRKYLDWIHSNVKKVTKMHSSFE